MQVVIQQLDVAYYEAHKILPASLVPRRSGEVWLVRETPLETALAPAWLTSREGELVQVPLAPYIVRGIEPQEVVAVAFKFGVAATVDLVAHTRRLPELLHVCVGHPVIDQGTALKFWLGFAFRMEV